MTEPIWTNLEYRPYHSPAVDPERRALAELALSVLTPQERLVTELRYGFAGEPKTGDEIATIIAAPRATVASQLARAMQKMRDALGVETPE